MVGLLGKVLAESNNKTGIHKSHYVSTKGTFKVFISDEWLEKVVIINVNVNFFIFFLEFDWVVPLNDIILSMTLKSYSF
jgi:hypothetical protein